MNSNVKTDSNILRACATALWLACLLVASHAHADELARSETVKFADLNTDTAAGIEALYGRVHAAARRVCDQPGQLGAAAICVAKAESEAVSKINVPKLTAYYESKTGTRPQTLIAKR